MIVFPLVPYICDFICPHFFWLFCYNFVASSSFVCLFYYNFIARSCILSSFCGLCVVAFKSFRSVCVTVNLLSNLEYMLGYCLMKLFQHLFHSVGTTICVCLVEFVAFVTILHSPSKQVFKSDG